MCFNFSLSYTIKVVIMEAEAESIPATLRIDPTNLNQETELQRTEAEIETIVSNLYHKM